MVDRIWRDLFLSIALHVLLWSLLLLIPNSPPPEKPVVFELIPKQDIMSAHNTVVRQTEIDPKNRADDTEDPLRFLSEKTQRVKQQMRAAMSGLTQNRRQQPDVTTLVKQQQKPAPKQVAKNNDPDGSAPQTPKPIAIPHPQELAQEIPQGMSTFAEDVPNQIRVGDVTALNTDRYLYYSYFSRAQELIWNEWAPRIQATLERPPPSLMAKGANRFTTILEVWFYANGQVHSTHLLKPSGVGEFDQIAESSFHRIGMIPNPPRERVESDGLVRFKWGMTVEYNPKVLVRQ